MTDPSPQTEPPRYWSQSAPASRWSRQDTPLRRFLGGSPIAVLVKLALVSLLVGAIMVWLDVRPADVFRQVSEMVDRLWALGFRSIRDFGDYMVAGAIVVVPLWLILRLLSFRGR